VDPAARELMRPSRSVQDDLTVDELREAREVELAELFDRDPGSRLSRHHLRW
jgi:hypothetical protein